MLPRVLVGLRTAVLGMCKSWLAPGRVWAAGVRREWLLQEGLLWSFAVALHSIFTYSFGIFLYLSVAFLAFEF